MVVPITARNAAQAKATLSTSAGAFNPNTISGLVVWFDASDAASITASGGLVSQWNNKKTAATIHATESTGTLQPTTGTRTINSLNCLDFQNDRMVLASNPFAGAAAGTVVYVCAVDTDPPSWAQAALVEQWGSTGVADHEPYTDGIVYHGFGSTVRKTAGNPTASLATPHVISIVSSATEWTYRIDGTIFYTTATNTVAWGTSPLLNYSFDASAQSRGRAAEIIGFTTANATDRAACEAALKTKWGTP